MLFHVLRAMAVVGGLAGCDGVFDLSHIPPQPDAPPNVLGCATRSALLCADFEQGDTYYANGLVTDVIAPTGMVTATVEEPGVNGGHALYVDSAGDSFRIQVASAASAGRIAATFDLELARFDTAPAMALASLRFNGTAATECFVALEFRPTPARLIMAQVCGISDYPDLLMPLPSKTAFVSVTLDLDLVGQKASATIGSNSPVSVPLEPGGSVAGTPLVSFGILDMSVTPGARVGFDNLVVTTQ